MKDKTHFGFQEVDSSDKAGKVAEVFHSVASKYDVMNDFMSMGVHRLWKKYTIETSGVRPGHRVLDLAGGTGDLAKQFSKKVGSRGQVVLSDINASMLAEGRSRMIDAGVSNNLEFVQANAECLPFPDNHFNLVTMAFGLRNVTDKDAALRSIFRILKPGGRLLVLEFSRPTNPVIRKVYDEYSFNVIPKVGKVVTGDAQSYQYLVESIRMHPDQETLKDMVLNAGFDQADYINLTNGVVAIHRGFKL